LLGWVIIQGMEDTLLEKELQVELVGAFYQLITFTLFIHGLLITNIIPT
jgi:hypothetical protein